MTKCVDAVDCVSVAGGLLAACAGTAPSARSTPTTPTNRSISHGVSAARARATTARTGERGPDPSLRWIQPPAATYTPAPDSASAACAAAKRASGTRYGEQLT